MPVRRNALDGIETRGIRAGNVETLVRSEGQVVRGDRWLDGGENVDLAFAADLEDGAAAVADVKKTLLVECEAGSDAHSFDINSEVPAGRDLIYHSVMTAGRIENSFGVHGEAGGVHQVGYERA